VNTEASFDIHGIGLAVHADESAVLEALSLRLEPFACEAPISSPTLSLDFATGAALVQPDGPGRPFYETPFGSVDYHDDGDELWCDLNGVRMRCAATAGSVRFASDAFIGERLYFATHPLTTLCLMEMLKRHGLYALHAGCVAAPGAGCVLVAGPSGTGKSTLAMALARAGAEFLSDDVVFLRPGHDGVRVLAFPDALGITAGTAERFPELADLAARAAPSGFPKRLARVEQIWDVEMPAFSYPRALLVPEIVAHPGRLVPLDGSEALLRLVPDVLVTQPAGTQSHLKALAALLNQVDCYRIESGPDLAANAALVTSLMEAVRTSSPVA
jgi:hypothetical protein